jgi:hypothetical protein
MKKVMLTAVVAAAFVLAYGSDAKAQILVSDFSSAPGGSWSWSAGSGVIAPAGSQFGGGSNTGNAVIDLGSATDFSQVNGMDFTLGKANLVSTTVGGSVLRVTLATSGLSPIARFEIAASSINALSAGQITLFQDTTIEDLGGNLTQVQNIVISTDGLPGSDVSNLVVDNLEFSVIPEPSSFALMGLGGAALYFMRRRRK